MSNYVLIWSIFFLITRNRNLQCKISCCFNDCFYGRRLENDSNKRKFGLSSGKLISIQILPNRCKVVFFRKNAKKDYPPLLCNQDPVMMLDIELSFNNHLKPVFKKIIEIIKHTTYLETCPTSSMDTSCIAIICCSVCDVKNFEINNSFLTKPFFHITKNSGQKC